MARGFRHEKCGKYNIRIITTCDVVRFMKAKKSLGQNFLINSAKINKVVDALDLKKGDVVIEIGPGHGELTEFLVNRLLTFSEFKLLVIEKDKDLVVELQKKFKNKNIEVISGDALKILKSYDLNLKSYKLTGNIPYYITGHLFRIIGDLKNKPAISVFTIQKEVAQRICALRQAQGEQKMNLLAASVQFWAEPKIIDIVSKGNFRPIPKVDSAIIKLSPRTNADLTRTDVDKYYRFIKILFKQPRKTILNNLLSVDLRGSKRGLTQMAREEIIKKLESIGINPLDRPEDLSLDEIIKMSQIFR